MTGLTPESLSQLIQDAIADVKASLGDEPIVPPTGGSTGTSPAGSQRMHEQQLPVNLPSRTGSQAGAQVPAQQPGIDWYRETK